MRIFCPSYRVCDRWRRGEEIAWWPSWKAHGDCLANTYGGFLLSDQHDDLSITPSLSPQIIIRIFLSFLLEGILFLINIRGCWAERSCWFLENNPEIISLQPPREKYFLLEVARWLVLCGGRPGSNRTSGLSMPQTPTTERCATWDWVVTGEWWPHGWWYWDWWVMDHCSLFTLHFIISLNLSLQKWEITILAVCISREAVNII